MEYGKNKTWNEENRSYSNNTNPRIVSRMIGDMIDDKKMKENQNIKRKERAILEREEKEYIPMLTQLGKLCRFVECFDMINLSEQNIPSVGPFEDPKETKSFRSGYDLAGKLIKAGFTEQNYHEFLKYYEDTFNIGNLKHK